MLKKIFERKDSLYEIKLIASLLVSGNIAVMISKGIIDFALIRIVSETLIVAAAIYFLIKLTREYRAFAKKNQAM